MTTDSDGAVEFGNLPAGTYTLSEEPPPTGSGWEQTCPQGNRYIVELEAGDNKTGYLFGNVCYTTTTGGRTIGFWSNRNGAAVPSRNPGWVGLLNGYNMRNRNGSDFVATNTGALSTWLLRAEATNMSCMFSAQLAATVLNINYNGQNGHAFGVIIDGTWTSINDVVAQADAILAANPVIGSGHPMRVRAESYTRILDRLNKNAPGNVIPRDPVRFCRPSPTRSRRIHGCRRHRTLVLRAHALRWPRSSCSNRGCRARRRDLRRAPSHQNSTRVTATSSCAEAAREMVPLTMPSAAGEISATAGGMESTGVGAGATGAGPAVPAADLTAAAASMRSQP